MAKMLADNGKHKWQPKVVMYYVKYSTLLLPLKACQPSVMLLRRLHVTHL